MRDTVTIHGWSFDSSVWRGTPFEGAFHITLPGHGKTALSATNLKELADEVAKTLRGPVTLVGWSLGATLSLLVAYRHPEKVKELVLIAPTVRFAGASQKVAVVRTFLESLRKDFHSAVKYFRGLCSRVSLPVPVLDKTTAVKLLESFSFLSVEGIAPHIGQRATVIAGTEDSITGLKPAFQLFRLIPRSTFRVIPGSDHLTVLYRV